ncbi:hypothetical protein A2U01_0105943, partial [Trifolium medium]|nr:hypothetical protein [Trifolium medium]
MMWRCTDREQEHDRGDGGAASLLGCSSTTVTLTERRHNGGSFTDGDQSRDREDVGWTREQCCVVVAAVLGQH